MSDRSKKMSSVSASTSTSTQETSSSTSTSTLAPHEASATDRLIAPSSHLREKMSREDHTLDSQPSLPTTHGSHFTSASTSTHATAGTGTDASSFDHGSFAAPPSDVSTQVGTNTAEFYHHPHADLFQPDAQSFLQVFHAPSATCASTASNPHRSLSLMNTLLSLHSDQLLQSLQPTYLSSLARDQVFRYIQSLVFQLDPSLHLFSFGSVPLKTYLPEGDIDIGICMNTNGRGGSSSAQSFLLKLKNRLEMDAAREKQLYLNALFAHQSRGGTGPPPDAHTILSPYTLTHLTFINAPEVKILKLQYNHSLLIDISVNTTSALATVCWIEEMEREMVRAFQQREQQEEQQKHSTTAASAASSTVGPQPFDRLLEGKSISFSRHLLKRSILLIKAWSTYESRTLASSHSLLSTYALEILVIYVLQQFPSVCISPLHVLYVFLSFYGRHWNWEKYALSVGGPIALESIQSNAGSQQYNLWGEESNQQEQNLASSPSAANSSSVASSPTSPSPPLFHPAPLLDLDLLTKLCTKYARKSNSSINHPVNHDSAAMHPSLLLDEIDATFPVRSVHVSTSTSTDASTSTPAQLFTAAAVPKSFATKHFNIIDPLDLTNNLGKSVNYSSFLRIKACWARGARDLELIFQMAKSIGEKLSESERRTSVVGASHILQLLESLEEVKQNDEDEEEEEGDNENFSAEETKEEEKVPATSTFTPFPSTNVTSSTKSQRSAKAATDVAESPSTDLKTSLHAFHEALHRFFRCTHKKLNRPHRPDLTGLHADESMQVLRDASEHGHHHHHHPHHSQHVHHAHHSHHSSSKDHKEKEKDKEREKRSEAWKDESSKSADKHAIVTGAAVSTHQPVQSADDPSTFSAAPFPTSSLVGLGSMKSPPRPSDSRLTSKRKPTSAMLQTDSDGTMEENDTEEDETASISSNISSINSQTHSPVIHPVVNLGPNAIDRLSRASSSFPSSALKASNAASFMASPQRTHSNGPSMQNANGGMNLTETLLGLGLSGLMPSGSVSQPSSLPSSPPSTPPARSSLPASPTLLPAPFPTPQTQRMVPLHFSPSFRFCSPFRMANHANAAHATPLLASPPLHRSLLTHSPLVKGFMLSPGVHGLSSAANGSLPAPALLSEHQLPASAIPSALDVGPVLQSFPQSNPPSHPIVRMTQLAEADLGNESDTSSAAYTQAQSFPNHPGSNLRPFILSQLQAASEASGLAQRSASPSILSSSRSQTPATNTASMASSIAPSPVIRPHSSNSGAIVSGQAQPLDLKEVTPAAVIDSSSATGAGEKAASSYSAPPLTHASSSSAEPVSVSSPTLVPPAEAVLSTGPSAASISARQPAWAPTAADNVTGQASSPAFPPSTLDSVEPDSSSDLYALSNESMMSHIDDDPLYNDLTDLQHQYNLLRYLMSSFHGSGSHTHTHPHRSYSHQPHGRHANNAASGDKQQPMSNRFERPERAARGDNNKKEARNHPPQSQQARSQPASSAGEKTVADKSQPHNPNPNSKKAWSKREPNSNPSATPAAAASNRAYVPPNKREAMAAAANASSAAAAGSASSSSPLVHPPASPLLMAGPQLHPPHSSLLQSRSSSPPMFAQNPSHGAQPHLNMHAMPAPMYQQQFPLITLVPTAIERINHQKAKAKKQQNNGNSGNNSSTSTPASDSPNQFPMPAPAHPSIAPKSRIQSKSNMPHDAADAVSSNANIPVPSGHSPNLGLQHRQLPPHPHPLPLPMPMPMPMPMPPPPQQQHPHPHAHPTASQHPHPLPMPAGVAQQQMYYSAHHTSPNYPPLNATPYANLQVAHHLPPAHHYSPYPYPPPMVVAPPAVLLSNAATLSPAHESALAAAPTSLPSSHAPPSASASAARSGSQPPPKQSHASHVKGKQQQQGSVSSTSAPAEATPPPPFHPPHSMHAPPSNAVLYPTVSPPVPVATSAAAPVGAMSWAQNLSARFGVGASTTSTQPTSPIKLTSPQPSPQKHKSANAATAANATAANTPAKKAAASNAPAASNAKGRDLFAAKGISLSSSSVPASSSLVSSSSSSSLAATNSDDGWETAEYSKKRRPEKGHHPHHQHTHHHGGSSSSSSSSSSHAHEQRERNRNLNTRNWRKEQKQPQSDAAAAAAAGSTASSAADALSQSNAAAPSSSADVAQPGGLWRVGIKIKPTGEQ